ncbi:hypothetical protein CROQUDRAFT_96862 [Cronartium quercuum f. sp. fusiforme G11]|uniref:Lysophospholipase n=1 Tax=Cronartium quercuum f. sp. fusiforme G11 TaxID=708437 RepID=A0A9P6NG54_9BASI|nr:hypothetical protein CROQUDRAFT_96862 [Cronartium quercuum f. sp. fusiforme G11]
MHQTGLSGGSWLLGSLAMNGYPEIKSLVQSWLLDYDLFVPTQNPKSDTRYFDHLFDDLQQKKASGPTVSMTDAWARALSYHFMPGTTKNNFFQSETPTAHGAGILFSTLKDSAEFKAFKNPYPIIVSNHQPPRGSTQPEGGNYVPLATTVFETTPHEFGSFDPFLSAFTPTKYLGTYLDAGQPTLPSFVQKRNPLAQGPCAVGFDQAGFIIGTSASLFNALVDKGMGSIVGLLSRPQIGFIKLLARRLAAKTDLSDVDTAHYPNPFKGVNGPAGFDQTNSIRLEMVDGGENGENVPLNALLAPARAVDIILAADASADTQARTSKFGAYWPNGTALITTFKRVNSVLPKGFARFPPVPTDPKEWIEKGYSTRPTFFGCNAPERTGNGGYPLIVYLPNSPLPEQSTGIFTNTSTFKLQYSESESTGFLESSTLVTTSPMMNGKIDDEWPTCLSCAMMDRARNRLLKQVSRSNVCEKCFERYCYHDHDQESEKVSSS